MFIKTDLILEDETEIEIISLSNKFYILTIVYYLYL